MVARVASAGRPEARSGALARPRGMAPDKDDAERMRKAEREVGENIPEAMIGEDDGDVREVRRDGDAKPR